MFLQIELRAFCSKHSDIHDNDSSLQLGEHCAAGSDSSITNQLSLTSMDKSQNLKIGLKNGDKIAVHIEAPDDNSGGGELQEIGLSDTRLHVRVASKCSDTQQLVDVGLLERSNGDDHNPSDSLNFAPILKKVCDPVIKGLIIFFSMFLKLCKPRTFFVLLSTNYAAN